MNIEKGKKELPVKGIVYGVEGIGKTTFASKFPRPLIIDVENGSWQMNVDRICPQTYAEFKAIVKELSANSQGYQTLVIDSADWLEKMMIQHICQGANIDSIEKYEKGYGKGWNKLCEDWGSLLDALDRLRTKNGVNLLFIGHSKIKRYEPADDSAYDRYTLNMSEKTCELLKKWSDLTLFVKYDTYTVEENGKIKVKGGGKRVMHTSFHPCWDAKNRYGLPEKLDLDFSKIAHIIPAGKECGMRNAECGMQEVNAECGMRNAECEEMRKAEGGMRKAEGEEMRNAEGGRRNVEVPAAQEVQQSDEQKALWTQAASLLDANGIGVSELAAQLEKRGIVPPGTPFRNYNVPTLRRIIDKWDIIHNNIRIARQNSKN